MTIAQIAATVLGCTTLIFLATTWSALQWLAEAKLDPARSRVDPWRLQKALMKASGQNMPLLPTVEKGTVLYAALVLEETSEMLQALFEPLQRDWTREIVTANHQDELTKDVELKSVMLWELSSHSRALMQWAVTIRDNLASMQEFKITPTRAEAKELLDGTTDIAVVNSGLSLAAGMPGAWAYEAVQTSNLSKRNPDTGVIDKDGSGKWIKGVDYIVPDMDAVLDAQLLGQWDSEYNIGEEPEGFRMPRGAASSHEIAKLDKRSPVL